MHEAGPLLSTLAALAVSHLWQSVAVAAALAGILIAGRRMSGAARHGLASAAMAATIVLPLAAFAPGDGVRAMLLDMVNAPVGFTDMRQASPRTPPATDAAAPGRVVSAEDRLSAPPPATSRAMPPIPTYGRPLVAPAFQFHLPRIPDLTLPFMLAWLAGSLVQLARVGRDVHAAERLVKCARAVSLPAGLARRLGRVRLAISPDAPGPMAAGLFRPAIILPETAVQRIGTMEMAALLEHELAHIERRDVLAALAQRIVLALLWWSPAMHWISRRIDEERESACDEAAVAHTGDARAFARALTSQAEAQLWTGAPRLVVGAIGRRSQFGRRIRRLVELAKAGGMTTPYSGRLAFTGLAAVVAMAAFATPKLAVADVPKAPPVAGKADPGTNKPARDETSSKPAPAPVQGAETRELDGAPAPASRDAAADRNAVDVGEDLSVQLADLGVDIGLAVGDQIAANVPAIVDQVREQLRDQGVDIEARGDPTGVDRERLRADMRRVHDKLKVKFGPEFREKILREVERARDEAERSRDEWSRNEDERRRALAAAHAAVARAHAEIEAARARGDFDFNFDFSAFDKLGEQFADKDWDRNWAASWRQAVKMKPSPDRRLVEAAGDGDLARMRELLDAGADVDARAPGDGTALIAASRGGQLAAVKLLVERGANVNLAYRGLRSPLGEARAHGHDGVAAYLRAHGAIADPNAAN